MEVYSPKRSVSPAFSRNEIRQESEKNDGTGIRFYNIKSAGSRRETFIEWLNRKFFERMKDFFEKDIVE
jgi:hypothetical protein